jgi:hypothetical protein
MAMRDLRVDEENRLSAEQIADIDDAISYQSGSRKAVAETSRHQSPLPCGWYAIYRDRIVRTTSSILFS